MTQGATLDLFNDLVPHLKKINKINKVGFCIADSGHYGEYIKTNNDFELTENYKIIKSGSYLMHLWIQKLIMI